MIPNPATAGETRPRRVDAQRNRDQVLRAARELLAVTGASVSVEEIARAAGVGVGTVHRNFPTKELLIEAVLVLACQPIVDAIDDALDGDDPGAGLERFLLEVLEYQSDHRALAEEMREATDRSPELAAIKATISGRLDQLVTRAKSCGQIRPDIGTGDIRLLLIGLSQTATTHGATVTATDRARVVRIVLDGLRTPSPSSLPGSAPDL